jgi:hypothetical protein
MNQVFHMEVAKSTMKIAEPVVSSGTKCIVVFTRL